MAKAEIVAMILAGGQGSRLGVLTKNIAKPAVPFGSRYRIIDFPLSNCSNSGIETVGVLSQYQPLALNTYVGNGHPWDLDRNNGGAFILPPYLRSGKSDWYKGTANAIFQNRDFLDDCGAKLIIVLSGDHIYKMNYAKMIREHVDRGADATLAVIEVPWEETSRFGILDTGPGDEITAFIEKPKKAKSNLASMGVYVFSWPVLREILVEDEENPNSDNDFGKDIVPLMLSKSMHLIAYRFSGYWKDVGTIASLWECNMDLLDRPEELNLIDRNWRIYSRNPIKPSNFISEDATVSMSAMTDGCQVYGTVQHSVLSDSVTVEKGAVVIDSVLLPGVTVQSGAYLDKCIVGFGTIIGPNVKAGASVSGESPYINTRICSEGIVVIEKGLKIKENAIIPANSQVDCDIKTNESENVIEETFRV
ncbi:MAG: glucose-1-phosphate adenylyltransferase [Clostridiaceae bacterium]|nr:glucose-1-phosphate adenylyltransferase [Clostridiaceae bacterium]